MTQPYQYRRPTSEAEAVSAGAAGGLFVVGGTEVVPWLADGLRTAATLVDLGRLDLAAIVDQGDRIRIGGTATLAMVATHPAVRQAAPALVEAIESAASVAIRERGSLAGNLLQGPRCPHWRLGPTALGGSPRCHLHQAGSGCAVREGEGDARRAAAFGRGPCVAVHPSDPAVALVHAGAELDLVGPAGERRLPVASLFGSGPVVDPLQRGELIRAIELPISPHPQAARFGKVRDRASFDFALVSVAVSRHQDECRLAIGGLAWGPVEHRIPIEWIERDGAETALRRQFTTTAGGPDGIAKGRYKIELAVRLAASLIGTERSVHPGPTVPSPAAGRRDGSARLDATATPPTPSSRFDAAAKVTGQVRFIGDIPSGSALEGVFVLSTIAAGQVVGMDLQRARSVPGVVRVIVPGDLPRIGPISHWAAGQARVPLMDDMVRHEGQPIALVLAIDRRAASEAAALVEVRYHGSEAKTDFANLVNEAEAIEDWVASDTKVGDVDRGLAEAAAVVDGCYQTADRHHAALEPAGVLARFDGQRLEVETSTQWVYGVRAALGAALGIPLESIRVHSPPVGGGFGAKGSAWGHEIIAALLARDLGRPVRLVLPRAHTFTLHGYQPATRQRLTVGALADGTLTAIRHESVSAAAIDEDYLEHGSLGSRTLYACPNIETHDRLARLHRPQPTFMRAPHEGPGMVGLEIALDELAVRLGVDPVALRLANDTAHDPTSGKPFSSRRLAECLTDGAARFGWARRPAEPGAMRDGATRIGWGMASALMATFRFGASARVTVRRDGRVVVETAAHEIGTGVGTTLAMVAGESLGVDPSLVEVRLSDTDLPEAGGTFGSATTLSVGSAVRVAAERLRTKLESLAGEPGLTAREYPELLAVRRLEAVAETGSWVPERDQAVALNAYGAVFVEVRVDPARPVPRLTRALGVYSVGRIVNPVGAKSQVMSGMIWGIGQALLEDSRFDPATGRFLARGMGSYQIPTQADIGAVDAHFVEEYDHAASLLGARGVGEIGTIGIGAAVANAVWHATGVRVRDLPIRVEALL